MRRTALLLAACLSSAAICQARADADAARTAEKDTGKPAETDGRFHPTAIATDGAVSIGGKRIDYQAIAGTLVVHPKNWDDVPKPPKDDAAKDDEDDHNPTAEASMFYVAYFAKGGTPGTRPVTFLFNGGPGSSSVWLHMGAFGPKRVITLDDQHTPAAPYQVISNDESLLDASDLVFVDAPGTGFSRLAGKDKERAFWGMDQDAYAFSEFIAGFLSKYDRWNSPKYLFGESYGTTRAAVLADLLQTDKAMDLNGVIMLSQVLNFNLGPDGPDGNPGVDLPYALALPTFAATAWYHHKLPDVSKDLAPLLKDVEYFAMNDYTLALAQGAALGPAQRNVIAARLHQYTGLPTAYILKADLRINGGEFEKNLLDDTGSTTGRFDTRFSGPSMDPLSKESDYDPQSAAMDSAYVTAFNAYVRHDLKYGADITYKPVIDVDKYWMSPHQQAGAGSASSGTPNVMGDLAAAIKYNPRLKVLLNAGYFDLATPYFEGIYEMRHLPMPVNLQGNIEFQQYQSGHMVYAHKDALKALHDNVADFIRRTDNIK